jgi:uncharacterized protein YndB with AHSA1/START domain
VRRGSVRREVVIDAPADAAWWVVGRPELLHSWFPGVVDCRLDGDQRTVTLATGLTLVETIVTNDRLQRRFQYRITDGPFTEHLASIDVVPLGDHRCLVTYATDAAPATMAVVLGGATAAALAELRRLIEAPGRADGDDRGRPRGVHGPSPVGSGSSAPCERSHG